ncbi:unnamed protein product [Sphagnum jensenii]|uniref:Kinesin motor domain-containing protein n=1 Tax=Sphagnum jensenii TaxID=128206 RepID=A0ABP1B814_9BRYO
MLSPRIHSPSRFKNNSTPGVAGQSRLAVSSRVAVTTGSGNHGGGGGGLVRAVVRVRPGLESDRDNKPFHIKVVKGVDGEDLFQISATKSSRLETYRLDACYGEETKTREIFVAEMDAMIASLCQGLNSTVFALGAIEGGKTHTMKGSREEPGLIPLALEKILAEAEKTSCSKVEVSYYQVYMDRCYNLLDPRVGEVSVFDSSQGGRVRLRGLNRVCVKSLAEFQKIFEDGCARRLMGQTVDVSSRSHAVLTVTMSSSSTFSGKLNLVDLAGHEIDCKTCNDVVHLAEQRHVNKSLSFLSNVISALDTDESRVSFRDSTLTRILQDSLGGNSQVLTIACLGASSYLEASTTMNLVARSRHITNRSSSLEDIASGEKSEVEAEPRHWQESQPKTPVKSVSVVPSPLCPKPPTYLRPCPSPAVRRALMTDLSIGNSPKLRAPLKENGATLKANFATAECSTAQENDSIQSMTPLSNTDMIVASAVLKNTDIKASSQKASIQHSECCATCKVGHVHLQREVPFHQDSDFLCTDSSGFVGGTAQKPLIQYDNPIYQDDSPPLDMISKTLSSRIGVLSPLSSNIKLLDVARSSTVDCSNCRPADEDLSHKVSHQQSLLAGNDCKTPEFSAAINSSRLSAPACSSPFEQFNNCNPNLQRTLVKQYLNVLNTATGEWGRKG